MLAPIFRTSQMVSLLPHITHKKMGDLTPELRTEEEAPVPKPVSLSPMPSLRRNRKAASTLLRSLSRPGVPQLAL